MFKILDEVCTPTNGSEYGAFVDLYAREDCVISAGETKIVGLGVYIDLNYRELGLTYQNQREPYNEELDEEGVLKFLSSHYLQLTLSDNLHQKGLIQPAVKNIDLTYQGEIKLIVHNPLNDNDIKAIREEHLPSCYTIQKGDKIAQAVLMEHKTYLFGTEIEKEEKD